MRLSTAWQTIRRDPRPVDADERAFVRIFMRKTGEKVAITCTFNAIVFHGLMYVLAPYIFSASTASAMRLMHVVTVFSAIVGLATFRWSLRFHQGTILSQSVIIAYYGWVGATTLGFSTADASTTLWFVALLQFYALRTHVGPWWLAVVPVSAGLGATAAIVGPPDADSFVWWVIIGVAIVNGTFDFASVRNKDLKAAALDWQARVALTPRSVLRHSLTESVRAEELFRPAMRPCVCLSSDWRNYQRLSSQLSAEDLEGVLAHYYQHVQSLLTECLPKGNYFADWIADELFVVVFGESDAEMPELVRSTLHFCEELLRRKEGLFSLVQTPPGVDVGLAAGTAFVGMMGPADHRKATALGELPGRSRRIQTFGRLLRNSMGDTDRVIFGEDVAVLLPPGTAIREFAAEGSQRVRDLNDKVVFFREPAPQTQTRATPSEDEAARAS